MPVLTGIDILGIQRYVFASNRLRDVLAASWMVDHIMKREAGSLLQWGMTDDRVLLAAGGNAIVEFENPDEARRWTSQYTRWLQDTAPGLEVVVAHRPYDGPLVWALKALAIDLARAKLERRPRVPQLGLSVTATCSVTGLPATSIGQDQSRLSRQIETLRRKDVQQSARERWKDFLPERLEQAVGWMTAFPYDLDQMGRSYGETSLLGVVHVDGNGVGQAISEWLHRCINEKVSDKTVRDEYRMWSQAIDELGKHVLHATIRRVASCVCEERGEQGKPTCHVRGTPHGLGFRLHTENGHLLLPLRPILLGGDDLTFVCDGRIALDLAAAALGEFEKNPIPHLGEGGGERKLTACAGVALVKAHAPFHRSYDLAEGLCASSKQARREMHKKRQVESGCWLDWQVGSARPGETVEGLRAREYKGNKLTMRPYPLNPFNGRKESWSWLDTELLGPGTTPETAEQGFRGATCWKESRSRVKRLGALVSGDPEGIQRQIQAWKTIETETQLPAELHDDDFIVDRTPLLDAIELLDLHLRLEPDPGEANRTERAAMANEGAP
jgi:hypothetical protein